MYVWMSVRVFVCSTVLLTSSDVSLSPLLAEGISANIEIFEKKSSGEILQKGQDSSLNFFVPLVTDYGFYVGYYRSVILQIAAANSTFHPYVLFPGHSVCHLTALVLSNGGET
jgi:hypothetical protein